MNAITTPKLTKLAAKANAAATAAESSAKDAVCKAIESGVALAEAKKQCDHGNWLLWLDENFHHSRVTATNFIKLATFQDSEKLDEARSIREGLKFIADAKKADRRTHPSVEPKTRGNAEKTPDSLGFDDSNVKRALHLEPESDAEEEPIAEEYEDIDDSQELVEIPATDDRIDMAAQITAKSRDLDKLVRDLKQLAEQNGGQWLRLEMQTIEDELKSAKRRINTTIYWIDCPLCTSGCKECRKIGWLSKDREKFLSREAKVAIS